MAREPGFEARFQTICSRCGRDIVPGERVVQQRNETVIHVGCASGQDE